jgi:hypothetical protein
MKYKICKRCVMDTSDPDITFDSNGNCNHCENAIQILSQPIFNTKNKNIELKKMVKVRNMIV